MEKQKLIEEMAQVIFNRGVALDGIDFAFGTKGSDHFDRIATALYNAGYRKIPEGAVVLTIEELEEMVAAKISAINNMAIIARKDTVMEMLKRFENTFGYCEKEELLSKAAIFKCIEVIAHAMVREVDNGQKTN